LLYLFLILKNNKLIKIIITNIFFYPSNQESILSSYQNSPLLLFRITFLYYCILVQSYPLPKVMVNVNNSLDYALICQLSTHIKHNSKVENLKFPYHVLLLKLLIIQFIIFQFIFYQLIYHE
jgi:hypothetical protein